MNMSTQWLGLPLENPFVPSASPMSRSLDTAKQLEDAGAHLRLRILQQAEHPAPVCDRVQLHELAARLQAGGAVGALQRSPQQQRALGLIERRGDRAHRLRRLAGVSGQTRGRPDGVDAIYGKLRVC